MLPDRVSNSGPLTYESGALPIALRGQILCAGVFCAVLFPTRCLGEILVLFESVSEGFPTYS